MKYTLHITDGQMTRIEGTKRKNDHRSLFLLRCTIPHHSPWKPQSEKSRVRAEPGEPKAPLFIEAFPLSHGFLTVDNDGIRIMDDAVADSIR